MYLPEKYTVEERLNVLWLWLLGLGLEDIARQAKVSVGSVRNFVNELKAAKYPEFEGFLPYLEGMRYTAKQMRANNLGLPQVVTGLSVFNAMVQLGIEPGKLLELFQILQRISPTDFPQQDFVRAILRVAEVEKATGLTYEQLEARISTLKVEVPELEATKRTLDLQISSLKTSATNQQKALEQTLDAKKVTLRLLEQYEHDVGVLAAAGFKIDDVRCLADFLMKARDEGFVAAAKELTQLEKESGKNYVELLAECKQAVSAANAARQELPRTSSILAKLNDDIARLRKEMEEELNANKTTRNQLKRYVSILRRLVAIGVDFEQLEALQHLMSNVGKLGWTTPSVVAYLSTITDLDAAKKAGEIELASITTQVTEARNALIAMGNQTTAARNEQTKLTRDVSELREIITQLTKLESLKRKHIDLAENIVQLMRDPSKLAVKKLSELMLELQNLWETIIRPESYLYPPDFQPIRKRAIELFETVLAKEYVPKEEADAERKRLGDQNTDLLMDRLVKIEQQKRKIQEDKEKVQKTQDDVAKLTQDAVTMTKETALKLVAHLEAEGITKSYTCYICSSTFTICLGTTACNEPKTCPSCGAPLPRSVRRFR